MFECIFTVSHYVEAIGPEKTDWVVHQEKTDWVPNIGEQVKLPIQGMLRVTNVIYDINSNNTEQKVFIYLENKEDPVEGEISKSAPKKRNGIRRFFKSRFS